jgi:hypothetical protein
VLRSEEKHDAGDHRHGISYARIAVLKHLRMIVVKFENGFLHTFSLAELSVNPTTRVSTEISQSTNVL